jgi:hypothetical protein
MQSSLTAFQMLGCHLMVIGCTTKKDAAHCMGTLTDKL